MSSAVRAQTLSGAAALEGKGIHSGADCRLTLRPVEQAGHGIRFQRPGGPAVEASWRHAKAELSDRRTVLVGPEGERFEQIEHVMAALAAEGVTDVLAEVEGPEVPFLGGGSREYAEAIRTAGKSDLGSEVLPLVIDRPIALEEYGARLAAAPHHGLRLSAFVEFPGTPVGSMGFTIEVDPESFFEEVARARTFAHARDLEKLRAAGLIKGGSLENAVVFDEQEYKNEALHFPDEVARHKIIDLLGDLALIGRPLRGHFWAWRAGHRPHVRFVHHLVSEFGLDT